ncbi:GntR family transcriptional regulator [Achromobacter mucicolens]|uniref:GntR family transcriptional regulator n=1 Tax=Achromobacter mucicolens TaxID=1389922 RepID=UPI00244B02AD|nr:GntR family transcriptional regulator [Achromobacter mucicolens]MDG9968862.1 GntR family transcriptional regulator [Achromobacter mucicolens]
MSIIHAMESPLLNATAAAPAADDSRDLVDEAYSTMLDMIQLGQLPINQPLQERNLASALGVSRTPLREAMSRLIGAGFAVRTARGQLIVPEPSLRQYLEIFQMRVLLEGDAAAAAATRMAPEQAAALLEQVSEIRRRNETTHEENHRVDNLLHDSIAQASGNRLMAQTIHDLRIKARCFDQNGAPERLIPGCDEHMAVLQAILNRDPDAARAAMQAHLCNVRVGLVARQTQI